MKIASRNTVAGITHHRANVNGTELHYVAAGTSGSPILLVHGFPETWWTFRKIIPLLAAKHRVFAVDLRGFGDSANAPGDYDSKTVAEDLHHLIAELGVGPVHLIGQDISGATVFRLAVTHPEDVLSLTAIEMGLAGFGLERLADVTHGGAWHIGILAAPGAVQVLLGGVVGEGDVDDRGRRRSAARERQPRCRSGKRSEFFPGKAPSQGKISTRATLGKVKRVGLLRAGPTGRRPRSRSAGP